MSVLVLVIMSVLLPLLVPVLVSPSNGRTTSGDRKTVVRPGSIKYQVAMVQGHRRWRLPYGYGNGKTWKCPCGDLPWLEQGMQSPTGQLGASAGTCLASNHVVELEQDPKIAKATCCLLYTSDAADE